jgi:RND family efflux transporter MFP subunit
VRPGSRSASSRAAPLILVAVALTQSACAARRAPPPPPQSVAAARPLQREVIDWDDYAGRFEAVQDVQVRPRVSGQLTRVAFKPGVDVKPGELLFEIDPRPFRAALARAEADAAKATATLANAHSQLARATELVSAQSISREEFEQRQADAHSAEADLQAARAAVRTSALDLEFTSVRAPIAGRVSDRRASVGDFVTAGQTLLTRVVSVDPIWFSFDGAESFYLKYMRQDASGERRSSRYAANPVDIKLADEGDYRWHGEMSFVDNAIDTGSGTIRAHATVHNPRGLLVPGMFGRARLLGSGAYHAVLVPDEAIVTDQTRRFVYVVGRDKTVAVRNVETGPLVQGLRVVKTGLAPTDAVVLDGLARLRPGARVEPRLTQIQPRAADDSPTSAPIALPPSTQATTTR